QSGVLDRMVTTADRAKVELDFTQRFPSPHDDIMQTAIQPLSLDKAWVYGLIRQESRFVKAARSSVGASGLMQIMPNTGRWIAKKLGQGEFKTEDLHDMKTNIRFGTFYLKSVSDDLDGSQAMASAAYNAGPNRPRAWRATLPGPVEGAIFAEIIPFSETRDYVKKVLSNAVYYALLQKQENSSLKKRLGEITPKTASQSLLP
ncbi:MAG: lytic transglycosylase domain-containing protein, partial [Betaproteobacteria bacterium]|nr:lytic transglycosylase domain-containing protein [Betaproteobacteria bacterium]